MESALSVREIQARLRSGETIDQVAEAAGVEPKHIEIYALPVLAEREHACQLAQESQVRRYGQVSSQFTLAEAIAAKMSKIGGYTNEVSWDAWRDDNRLWTVKATWVENDEDVEALFTFNQRGRYSQPANDAARDLIGDKPQPDRPASSDPDSEPTLDLHDEMAIVRAVQDDEPITPAVVPDEDEFANQPQDYQPPRLEQVDGIYDFVPNTDKSGNLDVLYEMLSGFNEDSVRIYAGLSRPPADGKEPENGARAQESEAENAPGDAPAEAKRETGSAEVTPAGSEPGSEPETNQDALLPDPEEKSRKPKPKNRKRASVPSWDEIIFGSPKK